MNNEYDNKKFFDEYAKMPRSREGLSAAGEWHQLKPLFPSVKTSLDKGTQRKTTENELPSLTQCTA